MSEPAPRRALCIAPKESPISRRRGTSVNTESEPAMRLGRGDRRERPRLVRLRTRRGGETSRLEPVDGLVPADTPRVCEEARPEVDAVQEDRHERQLDILGQDEVARV